MQLKKANIFSSTDQQHVRLVFNGQESETCNIDMKAEEFPGLLAMLLTYSIQGSINQALPVENPETEISSHDHALLLTRDINLCRWEAGAVVLQIQTTSGISLQIGLMPAHVDFLRHALAQNIQSS